MAGVTIESDLLEVFDPKEGEETKPYPVKVFLTEQGLEIFFPGYGINCDGGGSPVFIEMRDGIPHLLVWSDINQEDPTHTISLEGALESNRKEEDPTPVFL